MEILHQRIKDDGDATSSEIYIDEAYECLALEDQHNAKKVYGETRIPAGRYQIKFRKDGYIYLAYKKRFAPWFIGSLEITGIAGFSRVYYHCGLTDDDSLGCPLLGTAIEWYQKNGRDCQRIKAGTSSRAYDSFGRQVTAALLNGEDVFVTVRDEEAV